MTDTGTCKENIVISYINNDGIKQYQSSIRSPYFGISLTYRLLVELNTCFRHEPIIPDSIEIQSGFQYIGEYESNCVDALTVSIIINIVSVS